jgi:hypothetical protein
MGWKLDKLVVAQYYFTSRLGKLTTDDVRSLSAAVHALKDRTLDTLTLPNALAKTFQEFGLLKEDFEVQHFLNDWFRDYFPEQPVAQLFLEAFVTMCDRATAGATPLPVAGYSVASADEKFKLAVCVSPVQVTLLLVVPRPAEDLCTDETKAKTTPVWLVQQDGNDIVTTQVSVTPIEPGALHEPMGVTSDW